MEYEVLAYICSENERHIKKLIQDQKYAPLNRYCDILCYETSRVKLTRNHDTDYINACLVDVSCYSVINTEQFNCRVL